MAKKRPAAAKEELKNEDASTSVGDNRRSSVANQAWFGLAFWLSFGLLLEGLIGFRSPSYMQDPLRRELFRLAHAHGALLSLLLLIAYLFLQRSQITLPDPALWSLRIGVIAMPVGFLLGGMWHTESDPNLLIFLAPVGGVMIFVGVLAIAIASLRK